MLLSAIPVRSPRRARLPQRINFDVAEGTGVQPNVSAVVQTMSLAKLGYLGSETLYAAQARTGVGASGGILLRRAADSESCCSAVRLSSFSQIHAGRRHSGSGLRTKGPIAPDETGVDEAACKHLLPSAEERSITNISEPEVRRDRQILYLDPTRA
jgi:hypothetical protein